MPLRSLRFYLERSQISRETSGALKNKTKKLL